jgi:hypothetical protein
MCHPQTSSYDILVNTPVLVEYDGRCLQGSDTWLPPVSHVTLRADPLVTCPPTTCLVLQVNQAHWTVSGYCMRPGQTYLQAQEESEGVHS